MKGRRRLALAVALLCSGCMRPPAPTLSPAPKSKPPTQVGAENRPQGSSLSYSVAFDRAVCAIKRTTPDRVKDLEKKRYKLVPTRNEEAKRWSFIFWWQPSYPDSETFVIVPDKGDLKIMLGLFPVEPK